MRGTPRIVITGFMGAGKTTVARAVAHALNCEALDLDEFIAGREGRGPRALIDEEGEAAFREIESRALADALKTKARVIALGGGAWALERNRRLVREHGCLVVWLDAPFDLCWRRINADTGEDRPNARDPQRALALYDARRPFYALAALSVRVAPDQSADDIAAAILDAARKPPIFVE